MKKSNSIKVSIAYTDLCLPDYFRGDTRPWVCINVSEKGYTSRELRDAILNEFKLDAIGGSDLIICDWLHDERLQLLADKFYKKALPACLNREIKYKGKRLKNDKKDDPHCEVMLHVVFNVEYENED